MFAPSENGRLYLFLEVQLFIHTLYKERYAAGCRGRGSSGGFGHGGGDLDMEVEELGDSVPRDQFSLDQFPRGQFSGDQLLRFFHEINSHVINSIRFFIRILLHHIVTIVHYSPV
jgi:hypothetical protein